MKKAARIALVCLLWFVALSLCAFQTHTGTLPDYGPTLPSTCAIRQIFRQDHGDGRASSKITERNLANAQRSV